MAKVCWQRALTLTRMLSRIAVPFRVCSCLWDTRYWIVPHCAPLVSLATRRMKMAARRPPEKRERQPRTPQDDPNKRFRDSRHLPLTASLPSTPPDCVSTVDIDTLSGSLYTMGLTGTACSPKSRTGTQQPVARRTRMKGRKIFEAEKPVRQSTRE